MFRLIPLCLLGFCVVGCGGGDHVDLVRVSGQVFDGPDPVVGAMVSFKPAEGRQSFAKTREDGSFVMMYKVGTAGVVPGRHRVMIATADPNAPKTRSTSPDMDVVSVMPTQGRSRRSRAASEPVGPATFEVPEDVVIEAGLSLDPFMYDINNL